MTHAELAWQFADIFGELDAEQINEMLAKNVPLDTLEFFRTYGAEFGAAADIHEPTRKRLPNLMLLGYLLRVLEERLLSNSNDSDA